jgi:hypothetical protein
VTPAQFRSARRSYRAHRATLRRDACDRYRVMFYREPPSPALADLCARTMPVVDPLLEAKHLRECALRAVRADRAYREERERRNAQARASYSPEWAAVLDAIDAGGPVPALAQRNAA